MATYASCAFVRGSRPDIIIFFACALQLVWFRDISTATFDFQLAARVGEASRPGPDPLGISIINPTALLGKLEPVLALGAHVMMCSETSTTVAASKVITNLKNSRIKPHWSQFASCKRETTDGRPSLRGEAVGCAILSKCPSRNAI